MSKEPDWRKAYVESAENWKETENWEGLSPSPGQGSCYHRLPALTAAPRCFCSFFAYCEPRFRKTTLQQHGHAAGCP